MNHVDTYMIQKSVILIQVLSQALHLRIFQRIGFAQYVELVKICLLKNKPAVIFERQTCLQVTGDLLPGLKAFFNYW